MGDDTDERYPEEHDAREQLIDAEVEAEETLEQAERLERERSDDDARNEERSD
jgi:hypothetical protein